MFELLRLSTLHPALVHLPLGALPLAFLAYLVASVRRSTRWTFVGDVALAFSAAASVLAAAFGYMAYFSLDWPGGLQPWPLVHLVFGTLTTLLLVSLAIGCWIARRRSAVGPANSSTAPEHAWRRTFATLGATLLAAGTGYVGGEVLVFHGGMAVQASARGALAPPLALDESSPQSMVDAMHRLRSLWASCIGRTAHAIVEHPEAEDFDRLADNARRMQRIARWVSDWAGDSDHQASQSSANVHAPGPDAELTQLGQVLETHSNELERAAAARDLGEVMQALGRTGSACAQCHERKRWSEAPVASR